MPLPTRCLFALLTLLLPIPVLAQDKKSAKLPNILWITSEDHGPHLGCYGDGYARTPAADGLAKKGLLFRRAWSNAPVCAPARTTIITGLYPTSTGTEHMRSQARLPAAFQLYPQFLRAVGYYCTNKVKEDYNLEGIGKVWDDSSAKAHWKNRKPGQPFFAVFNSTKSHESQLRGQKKPPQSDPAKVRVPAYHPDTPEVRRDWAQYYDNIAKIDADAAEVLQELEDAGLLDDTIIFFYSDHGSGMPRSKRIPLNSGLQVPFIVYFPEKHRGLAPKEYQPGSVSDRFVSFVDLAPTLLSLAGIEPPAWMQGTPFAGRYQKPSPEFLHGFRGRMDERYDFARSVTDGRFVYLRNYMPHLPHGQFQEYQFETKTTQVWKKLFDEGKLNEAQAFFWKSPRGAEELYDLTTDPDEIRNLAGSKDHEKIVNRLRQAQIDQVFRVRDLGFLPEDEIHTRSAGSTPYEMGHDPKKYPLEKIHALADLASRRDPRSLPQLQSALTGSDSAERYWAALGLLMQGREGYQGNGSALVKLLTDPAPSVSIPAAELLVQNGSEAEKKEGLKTLLARAHPHQNSIFVAVAALNALDRLGDLARPGLETIQSWPTESNNGKNRSAYGIPRLISKIRGQLK